MTPAYSSLQPLLIEFKGLISTIVTIILVVVVGKLLDVNLVGAFDRLAQEFRELARVKWTPGSLNALGIAAVTFIGVLILGIGAFEWLAHWLTELGKLQAASTASHSGNPMVLVFCIALTAILSVAVVTKLGGGR